jgi:hypothetical protein
MVKPGSSFADSMALIAARIEELGKRPVSDHTHSELAQLRDQLDSIVKNFVLCPGCNGMFPSNTMAQMTLDRKSATLCTACAITALQTGTIGSTRKADSVTAPVEQVGVVTHTNDSQDDESDDIGVGTSIAARHIDEEPEEDPDDGYSEEPEQKELPPAKPEPKPVTRRTSTTKGVTRRTKRASVQAAEEEERESVPASSPDLNTPSTVRETTSAAQVYPTVSANMDDVADDDEVTPQSAPKRTRRTAKRPVGDGQLKATVPEVSKHTGRNTREVRNIAKLIEEISPPLDVAKTTRYVLSELKNSRSRIPADIVPKIVAALKNGLPSKNNGNGNASKK